ncbi:sacsin N-terminal ATP-binding-like domain-containing protein [Rufibacter quisquiliarum]|uniref:sacsin N-terminal ATP-binding-like domain-containing protein n=1 Tax=Rufibacter quisquiliarum TaxID=1549639 RepID=UPI0015F8EA06|nr:ATP-binding protein [Rufibacter quisquiliarum]
MMSLKEEIRKQYLINTNYNAPEQAINQAESLKSLSGDLYTESKRFIYELLQNADDSAEPGQKVKVSITFQEGALVVAHTGKPFDSRDVRALCGVRDGTKKDQIEKTGFKGIGFKAVFGQSSHVTVFERCLQRRGGGGSGICALYPSPGSPDAPKTEGGHRGLYLPFRKTICRPGCHPRLRPAELR